MSIAWPSLSARRPRGTCKALPSPHLLTPSLALSRHRADYLQTALVQQFVQRTVARLASWLQDATAGLQLWLRSMARRKPLINETRPRSSPAVAAVLRANASEVAPRAEPLINETRPRAEPSRGISRYMRSAIDHEDALAPFVTTAAVEEVIDHAY